MRSFLLDILYSAILGGIAGLALFTACGLLFRSYDIAEYLFFPVLLASVAWAASVRADNRIPAPRLWAVSMVSGGIYWLLMPFLPLLSAILSGISLGGGLAGSRAGWLGRAVSVIKGALLFPLAIIAGNVLSGAAFTLTGSLYAYWFAWGAALGTGLLTIECSFPASTERESLNSSVGYDVLLEDFKRELGEINGDIRDLCGESDSYYGRELLHFRI